ncbi:MAG: DUF3078 domain-containing protein [Bacteroidales bacterium]|nr:DUF3078 domain-containing protein [Bacteroidales bacterium]
MRRIFFLLGGLICALAGKATTGQDAIPADISYTVADANPGKPSFFSEGLQSTPDTVSSTDPASQEQGAAETTTTDTLPEAVDTVRNAKDTLLNAQDSLLYTQEFDLTAPIMLRPEEASAYIDSLLKREQFWRPTGDSMRQSLERLIDHYREPVDSVLSRLLAYNFDSLEFEYTDVMETDTLPLRWLNDTSFIVDTVALDREPLVVQQTITRNGFDGPLPAFADTIPGFRRMMDSLRHVADTLTTIYIDTAFLSARGIQLHHLSNQEVIPPLLSPGSRPIFRFAPDSSGVILASAWRTRVGGETSPFYIVPGERMPDSLSTAIQTLSKYSSQRDSILLFINDMHGGRTPFWLTSGDSDLYRYWIKNYKNDSITVWMGNPEKNEITLFLEEEVNIDRREIEPAAKIPVATIRPQRKLVNVEPLKVIPVYWEYDLSSAFAFNQTYLSNWSKGGENSVATMLDISGEAKYTDKEARIQWTNNGRLKYGSIITEEYGLRTNTDQLEFNSKFNKVIREKIDFSAVFYMKNQLARGYNYPNDSVVVSKFLNPGTFTLGVGFEYKPFKKTVINYSPLSYKNTFVFDTAGIADHTAHGIAEDKKVRQEMGGQLVVKNKLSIFDGLEMSNSLRLFSNYFNNPLNVDVDWEVNFEKRINWYFTINLNLHLIYDDDIRFPVMDEKGDPVKWPDGSIKKSPKLQFKEFVGLTFSFKF